MTLRRFSTDRYRFGQPRKPEQQPELSETPGRSKRAPRRLVTGVALTAQKCRLLITTPERVELSFPCRVLDVANGGYCIRLLGSENLPADCGPGTMAVLEQSDRSLTPVELRWSTGGKIGLKRLPRRHGV